MSSLFSFLAQVVLISLSGVMAPGPVTVATLGQGTRSPHAGALISLGHGLLEFPLMFLLFLGVGYLGIFQEAKGFLSLLGGAYMVYLTGGLIRGLRREAPPPAAGTRSAVAAGFLLSAGNPYFLIWWATVGAVLAARSAEFGAAGFGLFALLHWLCDFAWLYLLSALSFQGSRILGKRFQKAVSLVCTLFLLYFGLRFILDGVKTF